MTTRQLGSLSVLTVLAMASVAQAQSTADMSKVTCAEIINGSLEDAVATGIWLSGYYNGKRNRTVVDLHRLRSNTDLVIKHCKENPKKTVMQAVDTLNKAKAIQ